MKQEMIAKIKYALAGVAMLSAFVLFAPHSQASVVAGTTDTDGSVTGVTGATYYNVTNWQDMLDTYNKAPNNNTVYLNVTSDVPGSSAAYNGTVMTEGKGVTIIGNNHTLYFDNDTNYTTGLGRGNYGFYANSSGITGKTTMMVQDAKIINNLANGIFPVTNDSTAITKWQDVDVSNGAATTGAGPIRNDDGKTLFYGTNTFTILQNHNFNDASMAGNDNQGEWIQGGYYTEVVNGTTTLNQSWGYDQPLYSYADTANTLKIDDDASLIWNLNKTYTMYYDDYTSGDVTWDIGENAKFNINGTKNTASEFGSWFMWTTFDNWYVNVANGGQINIVTGGGSINVDAFKKAVFNFGAGSNILFNNLATGNLFSGVPGAGSSMNLNDPNSVTFQAQTAPVFSSNTKLPIVITGAGLRTHASNTNDGSGGINDLWLRQVTGTTDGTFASANMTPVNYTAANLTTLKKAKYVQWSEPIGIGVNTSQLNRNFLVDLMTLPTDGSFGSLIAGDGSMDFNVMDDRGTNPNFTVQVQMLNNLSPDKTRYYWQNPGAPTATLLNTDPYNIGTVTDDANLPSNVTQTMAGGNYNFHFAAGEGLLLAATNTLKAQTTTENATLQYSIVSGPGQ